jgi:hypothetical protein
MDLATIIKEYQPAFERKYQARILPGQKRAMEAMKICREPECGEILVVCPQCGKRERKTHSCGHRSCPKCQNHETTKWLHRQRQKLLPVRYFLVTFTVPAQLRKPIEAHQRVGFDGLFQASRETLEELAENERYLGGKIGMTGVLHTHSRRLDFHPHIHFLVPAGCLNKKQRTWKKKRWKFLFPENALAKMFRGKLLGLFGKKGLKIPDQIPTSKWVVSCKDVGYGEKALEYLSRYLYRGVIAEKRIIENQNGQVTFLYREAKTGFWKQRSEAGEDFLRLILQHVLPRGFRRARDYGFLHGNAKKTRSLVQLILHVKLPETEEPKRPGFTCSTCGTEMQVVARKIRWDSPTQENRLGASP